MLILCHILLLLPCYYLYYLQQNPLKLAYEIVQTEHESIDSQYSKEMHNLVNKMLQKVQYKCVSVHPVLMCICPSSTNVCLSPLPPPPPGANVCLSIQYKCVSVRPVLICVCPSRTNVCLSIQYKCMSVRPVLICVCLSSTNLCLSVQCKCVCPSSTNVCVHPVQMCVCPSNTNVSVCPVQMCSGMEEASCVQ